MTDPSEKEPVKTVEIDFGDESTYDSGFASGAYNGTAYEGKNVDADGYVIYFDVNSFGMGVSNGYFVTALGEAYYGNTSHQYPLDSGFSNYFIINLSGYSDCNVKISIVYEMDSDGGAESSTSSNYIALDTVLEYTNALTDSDVLASASISTETELTWEGSVSDLGEDGIVYLVYGASLKIASITIEIY